MADFDDSRNLIRRHLRGARHTAEGQNGARGDEFQDVGAAVDRLQRLAPERLRTPVQYPCEVAAGYSIHRIPG